MEMSNQNLCIALPTVNELNNLKILIPKLKSLLNDVNILVIDDASSDGTQEYLSQLINSEPQIKVIYRPTRLGVGSAHLLAINYVIEKNYEFLITMDADLTHSPVDALQLYERVQNYDLVIGSRFLNKNSIIGWSKFRVFLTYGGHLLTKIFFMSNLDMSSGLRAYRVSEIPTRPLFLNLSTQYDFFFISSLIYLNLNKNIGQVRVELQKRKSGKSKMTLKLMFSGAFKLLIYGFRVKKIKL